MSRSVIVLSSCLVLAGSFLTTRLNAASPPSPGAHATITITRASGPIHVDGDLSDPAWASVEPIEAWHQIRPSSDKPPKVATRAKMVYDDKALYLAFELEDPDPAAIRAPLTDRDNALASSDYAGIIIDGVNDGKTAQEFLANPRGVQYDAIWSDIAGEDLAPNFFWTSAARITAKGWTLEMRIPFSSIRYVPSPHPVLGVTLFRNWPRERRYEMTTATLSEWSCFICNENRLVGLEGIPQGQHFVFAPYGVARRSDLPPAGSPGEPLEQGAVKSDFGFDLKWNPSPRHTVDMTVHPDFSQVEADVAQVSTNQQFALFFPERRPFFLEGIDLFSSPISAIYTRTIADPRSGLRATGRFGDSAYTLLVADDRGGGSTVIPGPTSSTTALQDFESTVTAGRLRHDFGKSADISLIGSDREINGGGSNRLVGPDFQWRHGDADSVSGQLLWSQSQTPVRTDLAPEWDGRKLQGTAAILQWQHYANGWDWTLEGQNIGSGFRADNGYVPRVGFRQGLGELGRWISLKGGHLSGLHLFVHDEYAKSTDDGRLLSRILRGGVDLANRGTLHMRIQGVSEDQRVGTALLTQNQGRLWLSVAPSGTVARLVLQLHAGSAIDFDNAREGTGSGGSIDLVLRSRKHLEVAVNAERDVLDVSPAGSRSGRLFTADLARVRATWTFTPRIFVRVISQLVETRRDPGLYTFEVDRKSSDLESSVLLAYKLNWQSVAYLGWGDSRIFLPLTARREAAAREIFFKLSYALQH